MKDNFWNTRSLPSCFLDIPGKPWVLASQGTALSATGRGIHTQWEKEGTRDDRSGGEMQHWQQYLLKDIWFFSSSGWEDGLWGRKERRWRRDGEGAPKGSLPTLSSQFSHVPGQFTGWFWRPWEQRWTISQLCSQGVTPRNPTQHQDLADRPSVHTFLSFCSFFVKLSNQELIPDLLKNINARTAFKMNSIIW